MRDEAIEAMAEGPNPMFFKGNRESALMVAEDMLDALLDHLEANADEWSRLYWGDLGHPAAEPPMEEAPVSSIAGRLIEILRPPVSSSQENPE